MAHSNVHSGLRDRTSFSTFSVVPSKASIVTAPGVCWWETRANSYRGDPTDNINYCLTTWGYQCHRLHKLQKRAIRIITLSKYNDHTAPLFKKLNLLTIKDILALQELKLYYKFIHNSGRLNKILIFTVTTLAIIVCTKHAFAKQCLKNNLPNTLNATPQIVKDKLFTHSFYGFTNYVKNNFIQNYQIICTVINCYTCMRN